MLKSHFVKWLKISLLKNDPCHKNKNNFIKKNRYKIQFIGDSVHWANGNLGDIYEQYFQHLKKLRKYEIEK